MKILLDECVPRKLKSSLVNHECQTVPEIGLAGKKNGELSALAESQGFQVLVTMDRGIEYTQNLARRRIAILVLHARSNRLTDLLPLVEECLDRMETIQAGQFFRIRA